MKFSVCIDALFQNKDFITSMRIVKNANFNFIEFWGWWDKDIKQIKKVKNELDVNIVAFCTKMVSLIDKSKREEYIHGLEESIDVANELGCDKLISQVGNAIQNLSREEQNKNIKEGLSDCIPMLEKSGIMLLIEPLNTYIDHKGYYLYSSDEAINLIKEIDCPNIKVLYDIYHQQIMEGNIINRVIQNIDKIGHFHAAGNPGRHELDRGELNYKEIFKGINSTGYKEYIGLEYFPLNDPESGLKEIASLNL